MPQQNPLICRYLDQLEAGLTEAGIHEAERLDIRQDIDSHLTEAVRSGRPLVEALASLGPAEQLARAYCLELTLNPPSRGDRSPAKWVMSGLTRAGALLASTLLTIVMGSLGAVFLVGGSAAVVGGLVAPFLPSEWLDPTLRPGLPQLVVILLGMILVVAGIPTLRLVRVNLRFLIRTLRGNLKGASK